MLTLFKVIATLSKFIQAPRREIAKYERHGRKIKQRKDKFECRLIKFERRSVKFEQHKLNFDCILVKFRQRRLIVEQRKLKFEWGMVKFRQHCDVGEQRNSIISQIWPVFAGLSVLRS